MDTLVLDMVALPTQAMPISGHEQREAVTDEALLRAVGATADAGSVEKLYESYRGYVYALAYRILNDGSLAEEVVQEAFVTLWRKVSCYRAEQGSVKQWLRAIAHNCAIDKLRSWYRHNTPCVYWQELDGLELFSREPELWEKAWQSEQVASVRRALSQLPEEQRLVIELGYFSGYTHAEIAGHLHLALGTVKGRMRLGLQKMKVLLQEYCRDMDK